MVLEGKYQPSPKDFVRRQVELYEESGGVEGGEAQGHRVVILTSVGGKSGLVRKVPLVRVEADGAYVLVGSAAGAERDPSWCANLRANSIVELQDWAVKRTMRAREVFGVEKALWSARADETFPLMSDYRTKTSREFPVFVLTPVERP